MTKDPINPVHWRLSELRSLDTNAIHGLAQRAVGTLTSFRLILGRCLLALHERGLYKEFACSTTTHYGCSALGISKREAREAKRVAESLLKLPRLSMEAEQGTIAWGKLREIVRKATAKTEAYWIQLAKIHSDKQIEALVGMTPKGAVPGAVATEGDSYKSELRCRMNPEVFQMLEQARRVYSKECGKAVNTAQVLEWALAAYLSQNHLDKEALEKVREEADKDLQAERARQIPLVMSARELAVEMGVLDDNSDEMDNEAEPGRDDCSCSDHSDPDQAVDLALGLPTTTPPDQEQQESRGPKRPGRVAGADSLSLQHYLAWQNIRIRFNPQSRHTTKAQSKEILRRDGHSCRTPGCPNRVWLHVHHLKHYSKGGRTEPGNLLSLCSGCHRNHHHGYLKIGIEAGKIVFRDQSGRRLDHQADIELAGWLNREIGWTGGKENDYRSRWYSDEWAVFSDRPG
jgi:HNH endonuclease